MSYKLGIDVGGTCIDLVLLDEATGKLTFGKTPINPDDALAGMCAGINDLLSSQQLPPASITTVVHGTTFVADTIEHHLGDLTGLIVGLGQEDLPETGRQAYEEYYDINSPAPVPLVASSLRRGLAETIDEGGNVIKPLAEADVERAVKELVNRGVSAIAVALPNALVNPVHEELIRTYCQQYYPALSISLSSAVTTNDQLYERLTATVLNAYVQPATARYLSTFQRHLVEAGITAPCYIMTSTGNLISPEAARQTPVELLESGPVGSSLLGARISKQMGRPNLLSFDMGGTSAQLSLITEGIPQWANQQEVARVRRFKKGTGFSVVASGIDLTEIGAGATSLAYVDEGGKLRVGPESASPELGPACYDRGGTYPTVTDADLLLGYISETFFRGQTLSRGAARRALLEHIALPLEIGVEEAACMIHRLANETMANTALVHLLEKGYDPRQYNLLASGGAGPIHGFGVARLLGTTDLIIPAGAGVTATMGMLLATPVSVHSRPYVRRLSDLDYDQVNTLLAELEQAGHADFRGAGGVSGSVALQRTVELRHTVTAVTKRVVLPAGLLFAEAIIDWPLLFEADDTPEAIETVTWQVQVSHLLPAVPDAPIVVGSVVGRGDFSALKGYRQVVFMDDDFPVSCPIYDGARIQPGDCLSGPVIIEEAETTVVVGRKAYVRMDAYQNLTITLR